MEILSSPSRNASRAGLMVSLSLGGEWGSGVGQFVPQSCRSFLR